MFCAAFLGEFEPPNNLSYIMYRKFPTMFCTAPSQNQKVGKQNLANLSNNSSFFNIMRCVDYIRNFQYVLCCIFWR